MQKNTAIIRCGAIGDLISISSAVRSYKENHPDEHITLLCGESCADALRRAPYIDNLITLNDTHLYEGNIFQKFITAVKAAMSIRNCTKCFILHSDFRWELIADLAGIPNKYSLHNNDIKKSRYKIYMEALNGSERNDSKPVFHSESSTPPLYKAPYICIAPGGARNVKSDTPCRRWRGFQTLIELINININIHIVLLGSADDSTGINNEKIIDMCGMTSLSDAYHLINASALFIGNDSGLLHLAACTDTPALGVFTATSPEVVLPAASNVTSLQSPLRCSPCERQGSYKLNCGQECTGSIPPEDVFKKVLKILDM
ncbi:glycosyltransferase family 9 protein [Deferribacteres bacterium DY0037]